MTGILVKSGINVREYLRKVLLPSVAGSMVLFVLVSLIRRAVSLPAVVSLALYAIPLLPMIYALGYPYARMSNRRVQINSKIPFFATYFAVLSTSDVSRTDLVLNIASEKILEPIASDMKKVYYLMAKLHRGMPEALRFLARRTPSKVFADFLDRLAYSLDSGVELKDYLLQEQKTVMDDYETFYQGALYDLDVFKEVYSSLIISVVFMVTFIIIGPIITGQDIVSLSAFTFILVLITEIGIMLVIKYRMPEDRVWAEGSLTAERRARFLRALLLSMAGVIAMFFLVTMFIRPRFEIPLLVRIAMILSPLVYLGKVLDREEKRILVKDENFPAFMRSLSSSLAASGAALPLVLKYLSAHDFGVLTRDIRNLYRRISIRIDNDRSWHYFTLDTGSWLIGIFSNIFNRSIKLGADPDYVGTVISRNFERLVRLRRRRSQTVSSFKGVIYGITGAFAFSVAAAFQVAVYMNGLFSNMTLHGDFLQNIIFVPTKSGLEITDYILIVILVFHCLISALAIKFADGGHLGITLYYFVILLWLAAIGQYIGTVVMGKMMSFTSGAAVVPIVQGVIP
ncbi:archaellar assembly protein FlaJ [Thermococcus sp.]|uniref:archaellar assembly protein FlaJ n=1 Tax=Thermococcus sp. TaxID=35749 RepID=UPI00262524FF|nr:archaellar assembly protein FlaJ [Thermococcus sp.]